MWFCDLSMVLKVKKLKYLQRITLPHRDYCSTKPHMLGCQRRRSLYIDGFKIDMEFQIPIQNKYLAIWEYVQTYSGGRNDAFEMTVFLGFLLKYVSKQIETECKMSGKVFPFEL